MAEHDPTGVYTYDPDGWRVVKTHGKPGPEDYPVVWRTAGNSWGMSPAAISDAGYPMVWTDSMRWVPVTVPPLSRLAPAPPQEEA